MTDNELIAEFMGGIYYPKGDCWAFPVRMQILGGAMKCNPIHIQYHTSWDWLMPVVEKIYTIPRPTEEAAILSEKICEYLFSPKNSDRIGTVYRAVVEFIKWYNANK